MSKNDSLLQEEPIHHTSMQQSINQEVGFLEADEAIQAYIFLKTDRSRVHAIPAFDLDAFHQEYDDQDPAELSPNAFTFLIIGVVLGLISAIFAWMMGFRLIPILAVYTAVGTAGTLGSAVILALLDPKNTDIS